MSFESVMPPYNVSDPNATFLSSSCLDFLLIEIVPMAYRVANELDAQALEALPGPPPPAHQQQPPSSSSSQQQPQSQPPASGVPHVKVVPPPLDLGGGSVAGGVGAAALPPPPPPQHNDGGGMRKMDDEEERDAVFSRLETLGYRVGQGLVERFARDRPRFNDTLDVIKFLCKDLWTLVFRKQVDNLKTNHRGVYVLTDSAFRPFSRMSTETGGQAIIRAQPFLWFPCGIVRGALAALGITATVQAESTELPGAVFQIKTIPTKA